MTMVKLNKPVNNFPVGAEIEVSDERARIMLADGTAGPIKSTAPSTDNPPFSKLEGFGPQQPIAAARNKMAKPGNVHRK